MEAEDTIDYNIRKTWYKISKLYNRTANEYMASMSLAMITLNIDIINGTPSTKLGPIMGMESTSLTRSLKKLEKMDIIRREIDPFDKRKILICLTDHGKEKREIAKQVVINFNKQIFKEIDDNEIDIFFQVLKKINRSIDKIK